MPRWSSFDVTADRRLVHRLNDGDAAVLAALYDTYAERLHDYALSMTGDYKIAADLTHDTFIDAARRAARMRDHMRLRSWLYGAVRRRCVQRARSRVLYWEPDVAFGDRPPFDGHRPDSPRAGDGGRPRSSSRPGKSEAVRHSGASRTARMGTSQPTGRSRESDAPGTPPRSVLPGVLSRAMRNPAEPERAEPPDADGEASKTVHGRPEPEQANATATAARELPPSAELRRLLDGSVARLESGDQEALLLAVRHGLSPAEIATVLGIAPRRATSRVTRARTLLDAAYRTELALAEERCVAGHRPQSVSGEAAQEDETAPADGCHECVDCERRAGVDAAALLALASAPLLPAALRHRVLHTATDPELAGYRADIAARGGALTPDGLPSQPDMPSPFTKRWLFAGGGMAGALVTALLAAMLIGPGLGAPTIYWPPFHARPQPSITDQAPGQPQGRGNEQETPRDRGSSDAPGVHPPTGPQGQGASPPGSTAPPSPVPPKPGTLTVTPARLELYTTKTGTLRLAASGGPVRWNATSSSNQVSISRPEGELDEDRTADVTVTLRTFLINLPGQATLTFSDPTTGTTREVTVVWGASIL